MFSTVITITPNAASFATPYSSGDVIGGVNSVPGTVNNPGGPATLDSVIVLDKANQKADLDLVFFNAVPANSIGADNAAYALNDADLAKVIGRVTVAAADYVSSSTNNAEATKRDLRLLLQAAAHVTTIYCAVIARAAATYGSASDLSVKLGFRQDG